MANTSDYVRFTVYSKKDPSTKGYDIPSYEKDIKNIVNNAVKSALPKDAFLQVGDKSLSKSGRASWDIYVHNDNKGVVGKSLAHVQEELRFKGSPVEKYHITKARPVDEEQTKLLRTIEQSLGNKTEPEYQRSNRGVMLKLLALVTSVVDITRRILSSVLSFSTQTVKDMATAHNYGMSYESIRTYHKLEKAHGMKEGTITEAVSDIQNKFGNITSLDEKALEALAVVMGGKIEEMATMGLGASNPEAVLGAILDAFNEKANAGYNSVGQYVGEQQARRELYSYLLKISPQVADIFATMQEEQHNINSIFRNQYRTFEELKNTINTEPRGGHTPSEQGITFTLGQEWNEVKKTLDDIKEHFILSFAPAVLVLLRGLKDTRIGLSETQNRELNNKNKEANEKEIKRVDAMIQKYGDPKHLNETDRNYVEALKEYRQELVDANKGDIKGNIHPAIRTSEELRVLSNELAIKKLKGLNTTLTPPTSVPFFSPEESDEEAPLPSVEDLLSTIEGYNKFDLDKEKGKYQKYLKRLNARIYNSNKALVDRANDQADKEIENIEKNNKDKMIAEAKDKADKTVKNNKSSMYYVPFGMKRLDWVTMNRNTTLAQAEQLFGAFQGNTVEEKLAYALAQGYIQHDKDKNGLSKGYSINQDKLDTVGRLSDKEKEAIRREYQLNVGEKQEAIGYSDEDFLYWLYSKNQNWFDKHIQGAQIDKLLAESVTGAKLPSLFMLEENTDWLNNLTKEFPSAYGKLYGVNDTVNGEVVHRIFFSVDVDGQTKTIDLGSYETMHGFEGEIGSLSFSTNEKGEVDWQVSLEKTASEERLNQLKEGM